MALAPPPGEGLAPRGHRPSERRAVASRGLFRGWGPDDLAEHGIGFGLFEMPRLASKVTEIVTEDRARAKAASIAAVATA